MGSWPWSCSTALEKAWRLRNYLSLLPTSFILPTDRGVAGVSPRILDALFLLTAVRRLVLLLGAANDSASGAVWEVRGKVYSHIDHLHQSLVLLVASGYLPVGDPVGDSPIAYLLPYSEAAAGARAGRVLSGLSRWMTVASNSTAPSARSSGVTGSRGRGISRIPHDQTVSDLADTGQRVARSAPTMHVTCVLLTAQPPVWTGTLVRWQGEACPRSAPASCRRVRSRRQLAALARLDSGDDRAGWGMYGEPWKFGEAFVCEPLGLLRGHARNRHARLPGQHPRSHRPLL